MAIHVVHFPLVIFFIFTLCGMKDIHGLNKILQQPEVIEQMKMIKENGKETFLLKDRVQPSQVKSFYCKVTTEKTNIGQGQDLNYVYRDVGRCVKVPLFRSDQIDKLHACSSKNPKNLCLPSKTMVENVPLMTNLHTMTSALKCQCINPANPCQRVPHLRVYHNGTVYEKTIDVGQCLGACHAKKGRKKCQTVSTTTVSIDGANGAQCIQKIIKCACARSCYRTSYQQTFKAQHFDDLTKSNTTVDLVIDVGRCQGGCRTKKLNTSCIYWIKQNTSGDRSRTVCLIKSHIKPRCFPRVYNAREIQDANGDRQIINIVKRCGCK